jgi:hypothetical protein
MPHHLGAIAHQKNRRNPQRPRRLEKSLPGPHAIIVAKKQTCASFRPRNTDTEFLHPGGMAACSRDDVEASSIRPWVPDSPSHQRCER